MKTIFVGGGRGCKAVLEMVVQNRLAAFRPTVVGIVDPDANAPGMIFGREQGFPVYQRVEEALTPGDVELVIEVTGNDDVREQLFRIVPEGVRVMDHYMARIFWDLEEELNQQTELEKEIRQDRKRLQELLDSLPDSVMVIDQQLRIERVNRRFEEVAGLSFAEVEGIRCSDLCAIGPESSLDGESCPHRAVLETGKPLTVVQKVSCIQSDCGSNECYYQIVANPLLKEDGDMSVVITSREVTDQIRLARETEETARRARQILDTVRAVITITDLQGRFEFANPSAESFFGVSGNNLMGKTLRDILPPEVAKTVEDNDNEILLKGGHLSHEEVLTIQGTQRILVTERVLLCDYKNDPVGVCRVSRDVTNSRRVHQELMESEKHAAVGKLAAGVAHELNNPLTGVLTFSEDLLEEFSPGSPIREDLEIIMKETLRCRQIVRDLLDFSRQNTANRTSIPLESVIKRAVKLVEKQAAFHNIQFDLQLTEKPVTVYADPNQIQQVILNLIINARDAMDGKGILSVKSRPALEDSKAEIQVADSGCGIAPENFDKIFEPFFSTKGDRGNGLGLAAVRSIVEEHGGEITVDSQLGEGSVFRVLWPTMEGVGSENRRSRSAPPAYHDW